jgi:hypothetical protein
MAIDSFDLQGKMDPRLRGDDEDDGDESAESAEGDGSHCGLIFSRQ